MSLNEYHRKRDFRKTGEPKGKTQESRSKPRFVVQKHDASRLHYDFRLEMEGVLKSWAVPKGPSLAPKDKRLAVMVEDHPIEYADFEGAIPQDEYGAGTVMIWDEGTYDVASDRPAPEALQKGELKVHLKGSKLKGGYVLVRTKWRGVDKNWLLIKEKDDNAKPGGDILKQNPNSARTGRSMAQIAAEAE